MRMGRRRPAPGLRLPIFKPSTHAADRDDPVAPCSIQAERHQASACWVCRLELDFTIFPTSTAGRAWAWSGSSRPGAPQTQQQTDREATCNGLLEQHRPAVTDCDPRRPRPPPRNSCAIAPRRCALRRLTPVVEYQSQNKREDPRVDHQHTGPVSSSGQISTTALMPESGMSGVSRTDGAIRPKRGYRPRFQESSVPALQWRCRKLH